MQIQQIEEEKRRLTIKQRKWLYAYIETGNATEAAMQVYDCKDRFVAAVIGSENLTKLNISDLLEEMGLSDIRLIKKIDAGLDATKTSNAAILLTKDGKLIKAEEQGLIEIDDYIAQHKFLETALKMKKRLINDKDSGININNSKVMIVPSELIGKYDISHNAEPGS